ncbi:MAG TPA: hypothetical protein VKS98_10110, partial [Chthoniobacterales bacterium]|nr:hypothetical protein [Chthoniobacterales bacterium]
MTAAFFALRGINLDNVTIDAAPAKISTMLERLFSRRIALAIALATLFGRGLDNLSVDTTPTLTRGSRGRRWRRAMNRWRTRKREQPAGRIFRRTRRMIA